jgi:hypothetical protein
MEHGTGKPLHTLIPLGDFKALLGFDDREDCLDFASMRNPGYEFLQGKNSANLFQPPSMAAFCLITATYTIEQYCKRRLLRRKHTDYLTFTGEYVFGLREYPVGKVLTVHAATAGATLVGEARSPFFFALHVSHEIGQLEGKRENQSRRSKSSWCSCGWW